MAAPTSHHGTDQKLSGGKRLALQINVGAKVDDMADGPAQRHAHDAAQHSHGSGLGEEELLDVAITGADGFHDSNFAAALQNGHHQRIHNANRSHGQRQAAKNSQKQIEHGKELPQAAGGIQNGKGVEAQSS